MRRGANRRADGRVWAAVAWIAAGVTVSCGGGGGGTTTTRDARQTQHRDDASRHSTSGGDDGPRSMPERDQRALTPTTTFSDLVAAARVLDESGQGASDTACLLGTARLDADVAPAVSPLPGPPADLDARISRRRDAVRVLTRWGQVGTGPNDLALVTVSSVAASTRAAPGLVLFVTERFAYVRSTAAQTPEDSARALADADLAGALGAAVARDHARWFVVTAEAAVTAERLRSVLALLAPTGLEGALAVPLPDGTRIPDEPPAPAASATDLCPAGLPPLGANETEGDLAAPAIIGALSPVRDAVQSCMGNVRGPGAAGGRLLVALRIGADGHVARACARSDGAGDAGLRACVLDAVRRATFPVPTPSGNVDVELPLMLAPASARSARPLCD